MCLSFFFLKYLSFYTNLLVNNIVQERYSSNPIVVKSFFRPEWTTSISDCGVRLMYTLSNIAIDHIFEVICDPQSANSLSLNSHKVKINTHGFPEELAVLRCDVEAAERITGGIQGRFNELGLNQPIQKFTFFQLLMENLTNVV